MQNYPGRLTAQPLIERRCQQFSLHRKRDTNSMTCSKPHFHRTYVRIVAAPTPMYHSENAACKHSVMRSEIVPVGSSRGLKIVTLTPVMGSVFRNRCIRNSTCS